MTTIPFTRKNNLLSLLRGYDLPVKRNYLNAALLGYGKHRKTDEDKEKRYQKFRTIAFNSLEQYFNVLKSLISDDDFWHSLGFYQVLCAFTRFFVASWSKTSSDFVINLDAFLREISQSIRYAKLIEIMDDLADEQKARKKIPEEYEKIKEKSKNNIRKLTYRLPFQEQDQDAPDKEGVKNLILDCIVYSTETPEDFALNWEKYKDKVTMKTDKDVERLFSENLQDTAADDYDDESEGEYDTDDEDFVVPDDFIEYEEPAAKRRRDDDDEEVNGSGFYDWWW